MKTFNMVQVIELAIQEFLNADLSTDENQKKTKNDISGYIFKSGFIPDQKNPQQSFNAINESVSTVVHTIIDLKLSEQEKIAKEKELARKAKLETLASYKPKFTSANHINLQTFELLSKAIEFNVNMDSVKQLFKVSDTSKMPHDKINVAGKNSYAFNWLKDNHTSNFYNDIIELCNIDPIQKEYSDNLKHDKKNITYYVDMIQFYKLFDDVYGIGSMQDTISQLEDESIADIEQLDQSTKVINQLRTEIEQLKKAKIPAKKVPAKKVPAKKVA